MRPSTTVMTTAPATGRVSKGEFFDLDLKDAASITQGRSTSKITRPCRAKIDSVTSGGAADKAGLQKGDIVTNFNGLPITNATDLTAQVRAMQAGTKASLTYVRNGKSTKVSVTLGELKQ